MLLADAVQSAVHAKNKLNWRRPLFFALLPFFFIMVFLGFPLPVGPTPPIRQGQEQSAPAHNKKKQRLDILRAGDGKDGVKDSE